jgi:hypothetical protein
VKVEVLYVADCPSHPAAVKLVREILADEGVVAEVNEVLVADEKMAVDLKFAGSPTIRINGRDVAQELPEAQKFTLSCRLYPESSRAGLPAAELVRRAVTEALGRKSEVRQAAGIAASLGAIVSSLATIGCCVSLGFAAALGAGAASALFTTLRPWLLGLSVVLLGFGFWQQHRAKQCPVRGRWLGSLLLWAAVAVVFGMILFPQEIAGVIADFSARGGR